MIPQPSSVSSSNVTPLYTEKTAEIDSVVSAGAEFEGNIVANKGVCIEGRLRGNITIKNQEGGVVVIAPGGHVTGNIVAPLVVLKEGGVLKGNINASKAVEIHGVFEGDLEYGGKICVGETAEICGTFMSSKRKPQA